MAAIDGKLPFEPEVPLAALMSVFGDNGNEERASFDLLADLLVPGIPTAQLALVKPDFYASGSEYAAHAFRRLGILRGIA